MYPKAWNVDDLAKTCVSLDFFGSFLHQGKKNIHGKINELSCKLDSKHFRIFENSIMA